MVADNTRSNDGMILGLISALVLYMVAAIVGTQQGATARIAAQQQAATGAPLNTHLDAKAVELSHSEAVLECPPLWMMLPFALILLAIAVLPLMPQASHWWENNLHKFYVAAV